MQHRDTFTINLSSPWTPGDNQITAPATLLTVGEHCGSQGCRHYTEDVLRRAASQWSGVPVTWGHPEDETGPVSVQAKPDSIIGYLSNPHYEDGKLRATIHVTDERARTLVQATSNVSAGMFLDEQDGDHVTAMTPDHLAVLPPDQPPACDWASGCGIRTHSTEAMRAAAHEVIVEHSRQVAHGLQTLGGNSAMNPRTQIEALLPPGVETDQPATHADPDVLLPAGMNVHEPTPTPGVGDTAGNAGEPDEVLLPLAAQEQRQPRPGGRGPGDDDGEPLPDAALMPTGLNG